MWFSSLNSFASATLSNLAAFDLIMVRDAFWAMGASPECYLLLNASKYHKKRLFRLRHTFPLSRKLTSLDYAPAYRL
jgi:hypothetical protein